MLGYLYHQNLGSWRCLHCHGTSCSLDMHLLFSLHSSFIHSPMETQVWRGVQSPSADVAQQRTRDLLGGKQLPLDLDLDLELELQPISGWEKRLDMKSGKVYFHNCNSTTQSAATAVRDLNFPPSPLSCSFGESRPKFSESEWLSRVAGERIEEDDGAVRPLEELNFMGKAPSFTATNPVSRADLEEKEVKLKLNLNLSNDEAASRWQSVCTLDKVKMALKRVERDSGKRKNSQLELGGGGSWEKGEGCGSVSVSVSVSSSSCSSGEVEVEGEGEAWALQAAGCPRCLVYVLLPKANPKCPRCGYLILLQTTDHSFKRPRLHAHTEEPQSSNVKPAFDLNSVI